MKSLIRNASVAAAALVVGLTATAIARADDKPTLAFVVNGASDFWKAAEAGVKKAQGELPDYNLELKYPEQSSVAIQQRLMDDLVTAGVKGIMEFGPKVLVNAVGFGAVEDETMVSGDKAMLSHTPVGRAGCIEEAVAAVLFFCDPLNTYTTGQMLGVDGGWTAGYGRNF